MQFEIYLDVLVLLNLYVTYFLILSTAKMMSIKLNKIRLFLGSMIGGIYSLIIILDLNEVEYIVIKLLMGLSLVLIVFFDKNLKRLIKSILYFFLVNFIYGGLMFALYFFIAPGNMIFKNSVVYFNISALQLVIFTIVAYLGLNVFYYFFKKQKNVPKIIKTQIAFLDKVITLSGFLDTGNKLIDTFSGIPVIVCSYNAIEALIPSEIKGYFDDPFSYDFDKTEGYKYKKRLKIVFASGVFNETSMPAFTADYIMIDGQKKQAVIAVSQNIDENKSYDIILNPALF